MDEENEKTSEQVTPDSVNPAGDDKVSDTETPNELGGPKGPEPTRFGDWENNGRCTDF